MNQKQMEFPFLIHWINVLLRLYEESATKE